MVVDEIKFTFVDYRIGNCIIGKKLIEIEETGAYQIDFEVYGVYQLIRRTLKNEMLLEVGQKWYKKFVRKSKGRNFRKEEEVYMSQVNLQKLKLTLF